MSLRSKLGRLAYFVAVLIAATSSALFCRGDEPLPNSKKTPLPNSQTSVEQATYLAPDDRRVDPNAERLAHSVTIYRDAYGTPHIDGPTDAAVLFGLAWAMAEDNFWQVEDNLILALGRYSEVHGAAGLNSDLLNRAFEIVPRSRDEYPVLCSRKDQHLIEAFVAGLNYYLAKNPAVQPRLIRHFEPWYMLAYLRQATLELCFRYTRLNNNFLPRSNDRIWAAAGSNAWAIAPARTRNGHALLFVNPHLPNFGFAQLYEAHLHSDEGLDITGAMFYGNPLPSLGHNRFLGWTLTTNEPDIADVWRETFADPDHPLAYRYGDGHRLAIEWKETIKVRGTSGTVSQTYTFRKTHHGPVVQKQDGQHYLAASIGDLYQLHPMQQSLAMAKASNLEEFRAALAQMQLPFMNVIYADQQGNIFYVYNGLIPKRDASFDWRKPVDGADPRTEWQGFFSFDELPQLLNPRAGYVQNCNSSPFTTTHLDNPDRARFAAYMIEDREDDKRRAKRSREILSERDDWTLESLEEAAFDTTLYWARHEMPQIAARLDDLRAVNPDVAARAQPLLAHLKDWDGRITADSTAATLATAWYQKLYGSQYPGETLLPQYSRDQTAQLAALVDAAAELQATFGDWRVAWGDVHRLRRLPQLCDVSELSPIDSVTSLPCLGGYGPMGIIFTEYYTPIINVPLIATPKKEYGLVGASYLAVYEFGPQVRGASAVTFGASADADSPYYMDQAQLMSEGKLKPSLFQWRDVVRESSVFYHPGQTHPTREKATAVNRAE
jgi:acyl-homoserine-lactone acylase